MNLIGEFKQTCGARCRDVSELNTRCHCRWLQQDERLKDPWCEPKVERNNDVRGVVMDLQLRSKVGFKGRTDHGRLRRWIKTVGVDFNPKQLVGKQYWRWSMFLMGLKASIWLHWNLWWMWKLFHKFHHHCNWIQTQCRFLRSRYFPLWWNNRNLSVILSLCMCSSISCVMFRDCKHQIWQSELSMKLGRLVLVSPRNVGSQITKSIRHGSIMLIYAIIV